MIMALNISSKNYRFYCREELSSRSSHQALGILKEEGPQFRTPIKNKVKKSCILSCIYTIKKSMNVSVFLINSK